MSIEIIEHARTEEVVHRELFYRAEGTDPACGGGLGFPCDEDGVVDVEALPEAAKANYRKCLDGTAGVEAPVVTEIRSRYRHPSVGVCHCGEEIELGQFTNTCDCGLEYNSAGQQLADRRQWGEETGEHWTECVGPFDGSERDDVW